MKKLTLKFVVAAASIGAVLAALEGPAVVVAAAAETASASTPSTRALVTESAAKEAGFTKVVNAPSSSTDTGVTGCPYGAQEQFASASGTLGLVSEVLYCGSASDATRLLENFIAGGKAQAGLGPPKALGSTAVERVGSESSYIIAWRRGAAFELTALSTDLSSSSSTSTTTGIQVPLTHATRRFWQAQPYNRTRDSLASPFIPERVNPRQMPRRRRPQTQPRWLPVARRIPPPR